MASLQNTISTNSLQISGTLNVTNGFRGDFAYKEGPLSFASAYITNWNNGGHQGNSLNGTTYGTGIYVNVSGYYFCHMFQRAVDATNPYISLGLNGSRSALENDDINLGWYHDHSYGSAPFTHSYFIGYIAAGGLITGGPPYSMPGLQYSANGYSGGIMMWRLR